MDPSNKWTLTHNHISLSPIYRWSTITKAPKSTIKEKKNYNILLTIPKPSSVSAHEKKEKNKMWKVNRAEQKKSPEWAARDGGVL